MEDDDEVISQEESGEDVSSSNDSDGDEEYQYGHEKEQYQRAVRRVSHNGKLKQKWLMRNPIGVRSGWSTWIFVDNDLLRCSCRGVNGAEKGAYVVNPRNWGARYALRAEKGGDVQRWKPTRSKQWQRCSISRSSKVSVVLICGSRTRAKGNSNRPRNQTRGERRVLPVCVRRGPL